MSLWILSTIYKCNLQVVPEYLNSEAHAAHLRQNTIGRNMLEIAKWILFGGLGLGIGLFALQKPLPQIDDATCTEADLWAKKIETSQNLFEVHNLIQYWTSKKICSIRYIQYV